MGRVPAYSVVVSGSLPGKPLPDGSPGPSLYCAVIVKKVGRAHLLQDEHQRACCGTRIEYRLPSRHYVLA